MTEHSPDIKAQKVEVRVYSAEARQNLFAVLRTILKDFKGAHALGFRLAERNLRSKYRQSVLGFLWAFLPPIATAVVWIFLRKSNVVDLGDPGYPYPAFVMTGTLLWSIFTASVFAPLNSVNNNRSILVKLNFPREALVINAFYEVLFSALVAMVIITGVMIAFQVTPTIHLLSFIPCVIVLILMGMSIGLLVLPFSMLYKDLQFVLPSLLQFAMYLTPVVYAQPVYKGAAKILALNPVTPVLSYARASLFGVASDGMWTVAAVAGASLLLLLIGVLIQRMATEILIERMGG